MITVNSVDQGNPLGKYLQFEGLKVCCADVVFFRLDAD